MLCANCGFQNMPGSEACGRCATSLGLATAVMDVHPPRASSTAKLARRLFSIRKGYFRMRDALHVEGVAARVQSAAPSLPRPSVLARLVVPGWSHFLLQQRVQGHLFLWGFIACLLLWILMYGSGWGSIWLGMAFSVHSSAALNIVAQNSPKASVRERIGCSILVSLVLGIVIYWPCSLLLGEFVQPHFVQTGMATFQPGDVILVNRWPSPKRGDVVLYSIAYSTTYFPDGHRRLTNTYNGENIDRILAISGDEVQCECGQLIVNGKPSPWLPLNSRPLSGQFTWTVPPFHCLILPSGAPGLPNLGDPNLWQTTGNVALENIIGRAYVRSSPLSRFHVIR